MKLDEFISKHGISMTTRRADSNPSMVDSRDMNHYRVTIKAGRSRMTIPFSQGYGIKHDPELGNVLDCLASDASGFENSRSFEDWAGDYGYDTDSRKAERTFMAVGKQSAKLKALLGEDAYSELLWNTERE
jgi:hypothetical protein